MKRLGKILFGAAAIFLIILFLVPGIPRKRTPTQKDVERVLTVGASEEAVREAFGKPLDNDRDSHGSGDALYLFFPRGKAYTNRFSGFQVFYESNRVSRWTPIYSDAR